LIINPFLILYNFFRGLMVGQNPTAVAKKLRELGLPDKPNFVNMEVVGVALAAAMIMADGEVDPAELAAAEKAGDEVFEGFDEAALRLILQNSKDIPAAEDLARMLRDVLDNDGKTKVMVFLSEIAIADGNVSPEERALLERIANALGVESSASAA
jgi:uncharacterized tellurite resistance protein B-like protein